MADIQTLLGNAWQVIQDGYQQAKNSNLSQAVKTELISNSDKLQMVLNGLLSNVGVITPEQVNALDEQMRIQKIKLLELQSEKTKRTYTIIAVSVVAGIGLLWYLTRKK